ncbi:hypothetical protein MRB53_020369 [Persea americana]|uniref:Uncharacterized protein n=1 Tax=Persea americana TaxID=3435 RepID=A0ACC2L1U0_PERAE|nr:hypothetical protein MRB53_020369 [Persea americana]
MDQPDPCGCRRTRLHSPQFLLPQQSTTFFSSRSKHGVFSSWPPMICDLSVFAVFRSGFSSLEVPFSFHCFFVEICSP